MLIYHLRLWPSTEYRIAGKFRWCKFSYIWPKSPQNEFSYVLISHTRATRPHLCLRPTLQHGDLAPGLWSSLFSFYFDCTTDQESLGRQVVFIFACRTRMWNMWKSAPCENFPLYGICFSSPKTFMRTCTCQQMHEKRFLGSRTASTFHSSLNMHCVNQFLVWISCLWCLCFNMNLEIFFFRCIW